MSTFILGDAEAPAPDDGTTIVYDEAKGVYVPGPVPGGGGGGGGFEPASVFSTTAKWRSPYPAENGSIAGQNGTLVMMRITLEEEAEVSGIAFELSGTNSADGVIKVGLYDNDPSNYMPRDRLLENAVSNPGTGIHAGAITPVILAPGHYWASWFTNGRTGNTNMQAARPPSFPWIPNDMGSGGGPNIATGNTGLAAFQEGLSDTPATYTGTLSQHGNTPRRPFMVWFKIRRTGA